MERHICELCKREGVLRITAHHLIPKEEGGKDSAVIYLCDDCHRQIHALFTNRELAIRFNTIEKLQKNEKIIRYLNYIRKQPSDKQIAIKKSRAARKKER